MSTEALVERYLELGLGLGRHVEEFVDAYYGPPEIKERVDAAPVPDATELAGEAGQVLHDLWAAAEIEPSRSRWLEAQLIGAETAARKLAGEEIPYADEVERCYGVRPKRVPEARFSAAHEQLDAALPGKEPLDQRYATYLDEFGVSGEPLEEAVASLTEEFRARTAALLGLPDGEAADFEFVTDRPWAAFNYYQGELTSRIAVNVELPVPASFLAELLAHELYPGHHTEHATKEAVLVRGRGYREETLILIPTPQSLVSEAIAEVALEVIAGDDAHELTAEHLRRVGFEYDPEVGAAVLSAREVLKELRGNAAWMLYEEGASVEDAHHYFAQWSLSPPERVDQSMRFITDPSWRSYVTLYADGLRLGRAFVRGEPARFRRLLTEQLTVRDLVAEM